MSLYTCVEVSYANFPKNNEASIIVLSRLCSKTNFKLGKTMQAGELEKILGSLLNNKCLKGSQHFIRSYVTPVRALH